MCARNSNQLEVINLSEEYFCLEARNYCFPLAVAVSPLNVGVVFSLPLGFSSGGSPGSLTIIVSQAQPPPPEPQNRRHL